MENKERNITPEEAIILWHASRLDLSKNHEQAPEILKVQGSVIGTLEHPVHALNLAAVLEMLATDDCGFYVAVDASLGDAHHIGCITLSPGAMQPGLGVRKDLPLVGHVSVTGIVGTLSDSGDALLQGTRLSLVMTLADSITQGLLRFYSLCTP